MCDLHSNVVSGLLVEREHVGVVAGHPVDVFRRENEALGARAKALREELAALASGGAQLDPARALFNELMDVDKHYARKENLLFPHLERHGITGPSTVMWGKDDEVRELLGALGESLGAVGATAEQWRLVNEAVAWPALDALEEMIRKEELILLPLALQTLTELEWGEVWRQSPEIGWCLVDPEGPYVPPTPTAPAAPEDGAADGLVTGPMSAPGGTGGTGGAIVFPTGSLELAQLEAMFKVLPVDLTFVDADDRVRFFSEGRRRVFVRPKAVIGRKVEHCHPPASVHIVRQIVDDFRSGRQDVAEFWIELGGRFVHIRYFAVRDDAGSYLGTLEVTQDLTDARQLTGERRLLAYD